MHLYETSNLLPAFSDCDLSKLPILNAFNLATTEIVFRSRIFNTLNEPGEWNETHDESKRTDTGGASFSHQLSHGTGTYYTDKAGSGN